MAIRRDRSVMEGPARAYSSTSARDGGPSTGVSVGIAARWGPRSGCIRSGPRENRLAHKEEVNAQLRLERPSYASAWVGSSRLATSCSDSKNINMYCIRTHLSVETFLSHSTDA